MLAASCLPLTMACVLFVRGVSGASLSRALCLACRFSCGQASATQPAPFQPPLEPPDMHPLRSARLHKLGAEGSDCVEMLASSCPLRGSMPAAGPDCKTCPPTGALEKPLARSLTAIAAQTRGPAGGCSLTPAVRQRKGEGSTQSLAASSLHARLQPQKPSSAGSLGDALGASFGTVSTGVTTSTPGVAPLCPRRSSPPPYKSATLTTARQGAQVLSNHFVAAATPAPGVRVSGSPGMTSSTASADLVRSVSRADQVVERAATPLGSAAAFAVPSSDKPPRPCVRPSAYFEEYLWPFPLAALPESLYLDEVAGILGTLGDDEMSWADSLSCTSLDFSDAISEPELPTDWAAEIADCTAVCEQPDWHPLTTTLEQTAQVDASIDAFGMGGRKIKRKAVQMAQDAQFAKALQRQVRRK